MLGTYMTEAGMSWT